MSDLSGCKFSTELLFPAVNKIFVAFEMLPRESKQVDGITTNKVLGISQYFPTMHLVYYSRK